MYEHQTYEAIMKRMLDRVSNKVDKREGSVIYDALAPAAAELAQMYMDLDVNINLSYADTSSGEYLDRRTAEFGVTRHPATPSRRLGKFFDRVGLPMDIPLRSRFSIQDQTYMAVSRQALGEYALECESLGSVGNLYYGALLPIDHVEGLARAELSDVIVPGEDEESDENLRKRYMERVNEQPFGGNVADYKQKIGAIAGVGGVKVYPVWQGGGTLKCTLITSDFQSPSSQFITDVQNVIDPILGKGNGWGLAPIGHTVTIAGTASQPIDVTTTVTLAAGLSPGMIQTEVEQAISEYLYLLRKAWADEEALIVRISQIESRLLTVKGIIDVNGTLLNGQAANIELGIDEIPLLGAVSIHE